MSHLVVAAAVSQVAAQTEPSESLGVKERCGVVCYREDKSAPGGVELLLVTRRSRWSETDDYTIPAGNFEVGADASYETGAVRELSEEAGVDCQVVRDLGWFDSRSKHGDPIRTRYFVGSCVFVHDDRQESGARQRSWVSPSYAMDRVSHKPEVEQVMRAAISYLQLHGAMSSPSDARPTPWSTEAGGRCKPTVFRCVADEEELFECYGAQTGGHCNLLQPCGPRIRVDHGVVEGSKVVMKPCDGNETWFYRQLLAGRFDALRPFTCQIFGVKQVEDVERPQVSHGAVGNPRGPRLTLKGQEYLVLEKLSSGGASGCSLDLKMGCMQRAAKHDAQKREKMRQKATKTTTASLGFRICGMRCVDPATKELQHYSKYWGQQVTVDSMPIALRCFFAGSDDARRVLAQSLASKLQMLEASVQQQRGLRLWGASLLVVFDGALVEKCQQEDLVKSLHVKLIDFANCEVVGGAEPDYEFLCGLRNVRAHLEAIAGDLPSPPFAKLSPVPDPKPQDTEQSRMRQAFEAASTTTPLKQSLWASISQTFCCCFTR